MLCLLVVGGACAQVQQPAALGGVPEYVGYTQVYDLVEELADMGIISVNSVVTDASASWQIWTLSL